MVPNGVAVATVCAEGPDGSCKNYHRDKRSHMSGHGRSVRLGAMLLATAIERRSYAESMIW